MTRKKSISEAIDALAALYPCGALECAADPAAFVQSVVDDVIGLRDKVASLTQDARRADDERMRALEIDTRRALRSLMDVVVGPDSRTTALRNFMDAMEPIVLSDGQVVRNRALEERAALALYRQMKAEGEKL